MTQSAPSATPRGRGNRAGITRESIVEAARFLDPDSLTMQAVADRLGVHRKAINHHVTDLDGLLELLAQDAFVREFSTLRIAPSADWQSAARSLARAAKDSLVGAGRLVTYFRFRDATDMTAFGPSEVVLQKLLAAGFPDEVAGRCLVVIYTMSMAFARDLVMAQRVGGHPQQSEALHALAELQTGELPMIRRLASANLDIFNDEQFELALEVLVLGMERLLDTLA